MSKFGPQQRRSLQDTANLDHSVKAIIVKILLSHLSRENDTVVLV